MGEVLHGLADRARAGRLPGVSPYALAPAGPPPGPEADVDERKRFGEEAKVRHEAEEALVAHLLREGPPEGTDEHTAERVDQALAVLREGGRLKPRILVDLCLSVGAATGMDALPAGGVARPGLINGLDVADLVQVGPGAGASVVSAKTGVAFMGYANQLLTQALADVQVLEADCGAGATEEIGRGRWRERTDLVDARYVGGIGFTVRQAPGAPTLSREERRVRPGEPLRAGLLALLAKWDEAGPGAQSPIVAEGGGRIPVADAAGGILARDWNALPAGTVLRARHLRDATGEVPVERLERLRVRSAGARVPAGPEAVGLVLAEDLVVDDEVLARRGRALTTKAARRAAQAGVEVQVRSPATCRSADGTGSACARCTGAGLDTGRVPEPGIRAGAKAAQALGELLSQRLLRVFHEGGRTDARTVCPGHPAEHLLGNAEQGARVVDEAFAEARAKGASVAHANARALQAHARHVREQVRGGGWTEDLDAGVFRLLAAGLARAERPDAPVRVRTVHEANERYAMRTASATRDWRRRFTELAGGPDRTLDRPDRRVPERSERAPPARTRAQALARADDVAGLRALDAETLAERDADGESAFAFARSRAAAGVLAHVLDPNEPSPRTGLNARERLEATCTRDDKAGRARAHTHPVRTERAAA